MERSPVAVFAEHCRRRELAYQVDEAGRPVFRPRVGPATWRVSAGHGTVYAATVMRPRGGEPRSLVLVDLDEGFRMMSRVVGAEPDAVRVGARVTLDWADPEAGADAEDAAPVPVFRLQPEAGA
ncbi:MAG TPA: OB-fold domain-containing protein [Baekduia sp.]|nr:OB-fold domain-containing protein [Baekduia sp.]